MTSHVRVSATLRAAIWARRAAGQKQAAIAAAAGLHPTTLSSLINDLVPIRPGDARVLRVAAVVGVRPSEAFTPIRAADRPRGAGE